MKRIICNNYGHGMASAFSLKNLAKLAGILVTFPVSVPILMIREKIKKKKAEKRRK